MLKIRLQRVGRTNQPYFRIVLTESQNGPKSGKVHEILGNFDARDKKNQKVDGERVKYWISKGAKLSDRLHNFLITQKVITGKKVNALPKKTPIKKEAPAEEVKKPIATPVVEAPATPVAEAPKA
ncbi:MAG: 30S ribosomal protein S16 [Candidatus Paceibacterota bacterium]|jgi:small subunit ribosomal protein S16